MKPYYEDTSTVLYHGDCREVLPTITTPVDLILTDPPYGVGYVTSWRSRTDPLAVPIVGDESLDALRDVVEDLNRLLLADRHIYVFASPFKVGETTDILMDVWNVKNIIVWDKGDAGSVGDLEAGYGVNWEAIVYANKGRRALNGPRPRAMFRQDWSSTRDPVHPTVKPVSLLMKIIQKSALPGEIVIDPFAGSGTTLAAAKNLGCRSIGIELKEEYCEAAVKRLAQGSLFEIT